LLHIAGLVVVVFASHNLALINNSTLWPID
jgi:hypothetical protein